MNDILSRIKGLLHCAVLVVLIVFLVQGYLTLSEARETLKSANKQILEVSTEVGSAIRSWREYTAELKAQLEDKEVKRGIGLLIRSGDDISRTVKRANEVLEELRSAIRDTSANLNERLIPDIGVAVNRTSNQINSELLPELAGAATAATAAIRESADSMGRSSALLVGGMGSVNRSLAGIERRVNDPKLDEIIANLDRSTAHADATLGELERKTKELTRPASLIWRGVKNAIVLTGRIFLP